MLLTVGIWAVALGMLALWIGWPLLLAGDWELLLPSKGRG